MKRIILVFLLLVSFASALTINEIVTDKTVYRPGDDGILTITITLSYVDSQGNQMIGLKLASLEITSGLFSKTVNLGFIGEGTTTINIPFHVDEDKRDGVYNVDIRLKGVALMKQKTGEIKEEPKETYGKGAIKVARKPVVSLEILGKTLYNEGTMRLQICSKSSDIHEVVVKSGDRNFYISDVYIGTLKEGECKEVDVDYDVSLLEEGLNSLPFELEFSNSAGEEFLETITVPVSINKNNVRFEVVMENDLFYKQEANTVLVIRNKGKDAEDVRINFEDKLKLIGVNEIALGNLKNGEERRVNVVVYTELLPGFYKIPLSLKWKEEGNEKSGIVYATIKVVDRRPNVEVYIETDPTPLQKRKRATISVVVANKADYQINGIDVSLGGEGFKILDAEERKFIGSLEADDFSSVQYEVIPIDNVITLKGNITYRDSLGREMVRHFEKKVEVEDLVEEKDNTLYYVVGIVIIVGVAVYWFYKRRKR